MIYVGLETYSLNTINEICNSKFDGIVLGDLFCNKKMFEYEGEEIYSYIKTLKENGKRIIFQTPMYITDRNFESIFNKIKFYYENKMIDAVLVQDIGLVDSIKKYNDNIDIIWSRMGYARKPVTNLETLKWYKKIGITSLECKNKKEIEAVKEYNVKPYLVYGYPNYVTVNRECYYMYENDIYDDNCDRKCLECQKIIIPGKNNIETTINGFSLGWNYTYLDDVKAIYDEYKTDVILYEKDIEGAFLKLSNFKGA